METVGPDGTANPPLLFDVAADPLEAQDAASTQAQKLAEMHALLAPWEAMPSSSPAH